MANPTPTPRVDPAGINLKDGYRTLITFAADTNVSLWEKTVKPPGLDGGDAIDTTTMHNDVYRTMYPRSLKTMTECSGKAGYDPDVYNQLLALINVPTTITVTFRDGSTLAFYGYLRVVEFDELQEGTFPECSYTIQPTNWDDTNDVEGPLALASVAGT